MQQAIYVGPELQFLRPGMVAQVRDHPSNPETVQVRFDDRSAIRDDVQQALGWHNYPREHFQVTKERVAPPPAPRISNLLPPNARDILVIAAQTPITSADPLARVKAIEKAIQRVMQLCPQFFLE